MNENQQASYIISMAIGGMIEAMGMQAENQDRLSKGETIAYNDEAFQKVVDNRGLHHNAILTFFGR